MWDVEGTNEFRQWYGSLSADEQKSIAKGVDLLAAKGPSLTRPHVGTIDNSRHTNMKELRIQHRGNPYRVFFAFDPRRNAILLIGGNKKGDDRFYEWMIPLADRLYDEYLRELHEEGLL